MDERHLTKWNPVTELPTELEHLLDPGIKALVDAYKEQSEELREKDVYKSFVSKLRREWAIETGVLERLYEITDSATKVLIEHGLDESLLASSDTFGQPVGHVMALIRDQESAINGMYQFVAEGRSLSSGYIKQLHSVLTQNQPFAEAVFEDGTVREAPLIRGEWRNTAAQVTDSAGQTWNYCEPALLESQMIDLLSFYESHVKRGVPTEINAAWLHHQFSLIHPFQDGNGRVARCLATLVMLKAGWLPLVVTGRDKSQYIESLRAADDGDLHPLVKHFNALQKRSVLQALSIGQSVIAERKTIRSIIAAASSRLSARAKALADEQEKVQVVAEALRVRAGDRLRVFVDETSKMLADHSPDFASFFDEAEHGSERDRYYRSQVVDCAKQFGYFANLPEYRAWALMAMVTDQRVEILIHFHGIGHDSRGVMCCSPIYCQKDADGSIGQIAPLSSEPFVFSYKDDQFEVSNRFGDWLDDVVADGVRRWSESL